MSIDPQKTEKHWRELVRETIESAEILQRYTQYYGSTFQLCYDALVLQCKYILIIEGISPHPTVNLYRDYAFLLKEIIYIHQFRSHFKYQIPMEFNRNISKKVLMTAKNILAIMR